MECKDVRVLPQNPFVFFLETRSPCLAPPRTQAVVCVDWLSRIVRGLHSPVASRGQPRLFPCSTVGCDLLWLPPPAQAPLVFSKVAICAAAGDMESSHQFPSYSGASKLPGPSVVNVSPT